MKLTTPLEHIKGVGPKTAQALAAAPAAAACGVVQATAIQPHHSASKATPAVRRAAGEEEPTKDICAESDGLVSPYRTWALTLESASIGISDRCDSG